MDFSLIIPVLNEREKILADIAVAAKWLHQNEMQAEIIIADDGSTDNTCELARTAPMPASVHLVVLPALSHRGKGFALRNGISHSTGEYVMFADSGSTVAMHFASQGLALVKGGKCEIAHASRLLPQSTFLTPRTAKRKFFSGLFRRFIRHTLPVPASLTDTQCGFKIYRGDAARELYSQATLDGFLIDIEVILLARQKGLRIIEFPVTWRNDPDSRLNLIANLAGIFREWQYLRDEQCKRN